MEDQHDRVPTVFDEESLGTDFKPPLPPPNESDIDWYALRIFETPDLAIDLDEAEADVCFIAKLMAEGKYRQELRDHHTSEKEKAKDYLKKGKKRRQLHARGIQKERVEKVAKRIFSIDEADRFKQSATKHQPHLDRLLIGLHLYFNEKTKRPWRIMAGLFNLFNLRPEKACDSCMKYDPQKRRCSFVRIYECLFHKNTRSSLQEMTNRAKKTTAPDIEKRLKSPSNRS